MARIGDIDVAYIDTPTPSPLILPFSVAGATLTNQASAEQFWNNTQANAVWRLDLRNFRKARLSAAVHVGSASANTPRLRLRYFTSRSNTVGDYLQIGTSAVDVSLVTGGTTSYPTSGWVDLASGAKIADCYVCLTQIGGDGAADPSVSNILAEFR